MITNETQLIVSLAGKQSNLGAILHNSAYQKLDVNFVYVPITTDDIENAIAGVRGFKLRGSTVSMPHKQKVLQYLDKIDSIAQEIGAVNTVHNDRGILTGFNSDWIGAMNALKETTKIEGRKVAVIGAGGVARAIVYGLVKNKANVTIYNRTVEKGKNLAEEFGVEFGGNLTNLSSVNNYDIVINASPVGSVKSNIDESTVNETFFNNKMVAMDVITVPAKTKFLEYAEEKGAKIVYGYRMLIHQAIFQIELFTGKKAPFEVMEKALLEVIKE